ncbi:MAG TPA: hypothetical protein DCZ95_12980 [Verrucomicrobia bacterium]|nr:MAG: hypothetical protein A2X46_11680 [Lentisphaerae bacterium GWF2_57_35]HBA85002.1 hypothetical protein [Verrucomicrobiota bacterium]
MAGLLLCAAVGWGSPASSGVLIDVGAPPSESSLGFGWSKREKDSERTFQWIDRMEADVWFELAAPAAMRLYVTAAPQYMGWRRQKVGVILNDRYLGEFLCEHNPSFQVYDLPVPSEYLLAGKNRLVLRMAYRESLGRDPRELALAVDAVELKPE